VEDAAAADAEPLVDAALAADADAAWALDDDKEVLSNEEDPPVEPEVLAVPVEDDAVVADALVVADEAALPVELLTEAVPNVPAPSTLLSMVSMYH
jgi:hypothetical protein